MIPTFSNTENVGPEISAPESKFGTDSIVHYREQEMPTVWFQVDELKQLC